MYETENKNENSERCAVHWIAPMFQWKGIHDRGVTDEQRCVRDVFTTAGPFDWNGRITSITVLQGRLVKWSKGVHVARLSDDVIFINNLIKICCKGEAYLPQNTQKNWFYKTYAYFKTLFNLYFFIRFILFNWITFRFFYFCMYKNRALSSVHTE